MKTLDVSFTDNNVVVLILCKKEKEKIPCIDGLGIIILLSSRNAISGDFFSIFVYTRNQALWAWC